jgi:hypothetical protein
MSNGSSSDEEALPGLTKIETIDYRWLMRRRDIANERQLARLSELKNKQLVAKLSLPRTTSRSPPRWLWLIVLALALLLVLECVRALKKD